MGGGERQRRRERDGGSRGRREGSGGSRQGSTCLTKDIGEASLLCQDAWSHQWPSKSPVRWGERAYIHERGQREGPVRTPQTTTYITDNNTHTHNTHTALTKTSKHPFIHTHTLTQHTAQTQKVIFLCKLTSL